MYASSPGTAPLRRARFRFLAGVPARVVKRLDPAKFGPWKYKEEYYGFISAAEFESDPQKYLDKYLDKDVFSVINGRIEFSPEYLIR